MIVISSFAMNDAKKKWFTRLLVLVEVIVVVFFTYLF